ncbi:MAG: aldehyde dehydrogenase family protein, partial [Polycyclovorans sp.]
MSLQTRNPATGDVLDTYPEQTPAEVHGVLDQAVAAQRRWQDLGFAERARGMRAVAEALEARADTFARLMALEMGKPLAQGASEARKSASACRYYAEHAEAFLADQPVAIDSGSAAISHAPLGVILGVMPWNFPLWQVLRFAAPTLMAGNTVLIKHAPNVTGTALGLAQLFDDVGLGGGVYSALVIDLAPTATVIADPRVAAVSLT